MAGLVRKDFTITPQQNDKLKALAREWRCSESEVLRRVIDAMADSGSRVEPDEAQRGLIR